MHCLRFNSCSHSISHGTVCTCVYYSVLSPWLQGSYSGALKASGVTPCSFASAGEFRESMSRPRQRLPLGSPSSCCRCTSSTPSVTSLPRDYVEMIFKVGVVVQDRNRTAKLHRLRVDLRATECGFAHGRRIRAGRSFWDAVAIDFPNTQQWKDRLKQQKSVSRAFS